MAYSIQRATSDGTLDTIVLSIEYFDKTDISVFIDDVLLPDGTYTWAWDGEDIKITPVVANGSEVLVRRSTKFDDMYHNFDSGAVFSDTTMDDNFRQLLFIFQEGVEGLTATDFYADLNLHGYRLMKVGNAVDVDDAVPFGQYRADALGAYQHRLFAEAAATAADVSEANALTSANAASTSATNALNSANASAASAVTAGNSATAAQGYRDQAEAYKNAAAASASAASTSETNAAASAAAAAASAASIDDANLVHKTGDETIGGIKTFTSTPVLPANATTALQAVPKQQLDAVEGALDSRLDILEARDSWHYLGTATFSASPNLAFDGIPAWVNELQVTIEEYSATASSAFVLQLAVGGVYQTTGYVGSEGRVTASATGFNTAVQGIPALLSASAGIIAEGVFTLRRMTGNKWNATGNWGAGTANGFVVSIVTLSGPLSGIRLNTSAGNLDGGVLHIAGRA